MKINSSFNSAFKKKRTIRTSPRARHYSQLTRAVRNKIYIDISPLSDALLRPAIDLLRRPRLPAANIITLTESKILWDAFKFNYHRIHWDSLAFLMKFSINYAARTRDCSCMQIQFLLHQKKKIGRFVHFHISIRRCVFPYGAPRWRWWRFLLRRDVHQKIRRSKGGNSFWRLAPFREPNGH